jgi:hypothetical protein
MPQTPPAAPDLEVQRAAMSKLQFLVGSWTGEARLFRGPGEPIVLTQTEDVQFKLDGLLLLIEGVGRSQADGKPLLQALGVVSYDDASGTYTMRAFNDGRFLETEVKLTADGGKSLAWGFSFGEIRTHSVLRLEDNGDWTEAHEITIGSKPAVKFMDLRVSPRR